MRVNRLWKMTMVLILMSVLLQPAALAEIPQSASTYEDFSLPIVAYHKVCGKSTSTCVTKAQLEEQLRHLHDAGYRTISFADLLRWEMGIGLLPEKPLILTFDDGYRDNDTTVLPMLKERGLKATVFPVSRLIGTKGYLTWQQVKEMQNSGIFEVGAHTLTHPDLTKLPADKKREEIVQSGREIEAHTGRPALAFAYPYGLYDEETERIVREAGYVYAVSGEIGWALPGKEPLHMKRIIISGFTTMEEFKKLVP